jgi:MOSC domain-containing protein YiiM
MKLLSINTAIAAPMITAQGMVMSAISKAPREGAIAVKRLGLVGDEQADLSVHGGLEKALYLYPHEHYAVWRNIIAQHKKTSVEDRLNMPMGQLGENLTIEGLLEKQVWVGDKLVFPHCTLIITEPRMPCYKFNIRMGFSHAAKMMVQSGYCGFYAAVLHEGEITAGESFTLQPGARDVSIAELFEMKTRKEKTRDLF